MRVFRAQGPLPSSGRPQVAFLFLVVVLWASAGAPAAAETGLSARRIRERGHLTACVPEAPLGTATRQPRTGQWIGVDVEMMEMLAARLRSSVRWRQVSSSELPSALLDGRCDLGVGGWTSAAALRAGLPTTRSLRQVDACAVTSRRPGRPRTWGELVRSSRRTAALGVSGFAPALRSTMHQGQVIESDALPVLMRHLHADRVDSVVMDRVRAEHVAEDDRAVVLVCPEEPYQVQSLAYVLPRDDVAWWRTVDDFVRRALDDGTLRSLTERQRPHRTGVWP